MPRALEADPAEGGAEPRSRPAQFELRAKVRVAPALATVRTPPDILPEEPQATSGLLDLVGPTARRALELGLAAREPSFHVFVAARPEVGIEDDVLAYALRFAREHAPHTGAQTPPDLAYVHDFDHPEAPRALVLPPGVGTKLQAAMVACLDTLREQVAAIARSRAGTRGAARHRERARGEEPRGLDRPRGCGQDVRLRRPLGARWCADISDPARQTAQRRAVRSPRRIDEEGAHRVGGASHAGSRKERRTRAKQQRSLSRSAAPRAPRRRARGRARSDGEALRRVRVLRTRRRRMARPGHRRAGAGLARSRSGRR